MRTTDDLAAAAEAGLITPDQAKAVADFLAARAKPEEGEEELRFIRNFHDVFLAAGIVILATGLALGAYYLTDWRAWSEWSVSRYLVENGPPPPHSSWAYALALVCCAGAQWALAEAFARRRRLFLPAIALCVLFGGFAASGLTHLYAAMTEHRALFNDHRLAAPHAQSWDAVILGAGALAASAAYYARFRLPFSLAACAAAMAFSAFAILHKIGEKVFESFGPILSLALGAGLFTIAMAFDMRDPHRKSRLSDNGFWLHFAAAPLILFGAVTLAARLGGAAAREEISAALTLAIVAVLAIASLLINRRALVASALITTGLAIGALLKRAGLESSGLAAATLVTLGGGVLLLGAGWRPARRVLLAWVAPDTFAARLFPPEDSKPI